MTLEEAVMNYREKHEAMLDTGSKLDAAKATGLAKIEADKAGGVLDRHALGLSETP